MSKLKGEAVADDDLGNYSVGESGSEFVVPYMELKPEARLNRLLFLWRKVHSRARNAARIKNRFYGLQQQLLRNGTTKNLLLSQLRSQQKRSWFLISRDGNFRMVWNLLMVTFILYMAVYGPYRIAFIEDSEANPILTGFDVVIDIFFLADIVVTFMTDYQDPKTNHTVSDFKSIARNYLLSTFFLDLMAAVPFSLLDILNQ